MAQHDFTLDNANGAAFRADLNSAIEAIVTNSSGATAPSPTFANMWWADTSTVILKRRNNANTAWISVMDLATGLIIGTDVQAYHANLAALSALTITSGDILYGDASSPSSLVRLAKGADGQVLTLASGLPSWAASSGATLATPVASTSGTSIDFTSIPSGTKQIVIMFDGVSVSGTSNPLVQIGDAGGVEATGYLGSGSFNNGAAVNYTTGFGLNSASAANVFNGSFILTLMDSTNFTWVCNAVLGQSNAATTLHTGGSKSLSAELDRVRITTVGGTDTFDAGSINISYE